MGQEAPVTNRRKVYISGKENRNTKLQVECIGSGWLETVVWFYDFFGAVDRLDMKCFWWGTEQGHEALV